MSDKIAYKPINAEEAADVEEADTTNRSAPRWTLPNSQHWSRGWMRISFEVVLVVVIFLLSLKIMLDDRTSTNSGCKGPNDPKKDFGFIDTVFMNESRYSNEWIFTSETTLAETLENWVELSSKGRGYVGIPEAERDTLDAPPYLLNPWMRPDRKELYMVSGFHQLHCLSTIMESYAHLRLGQHETHMGYHIAHCFDYLRKGILCAGDTTLEGNNTAKYPNVEIPWGNSHRCANWKAIQQWADERTVFPVLPGLDTSI